MNVCWEPWLHSAGELSPEVASLLFLKKPDLKDPHSSEFQLWPGHLPSVLAVQLGRVPGGCQSERLHWHLDKLYGRFFKILLLELLR